jgi:hypothetical protein
LAKSTTGQEMSDRVIIVTPPDDTLLDGIRFLAVDLDQSQTQVLSSSLSKLVSMPNIIVYIWNTGDSVDWLFDKKQKSEVIVFNANSQNELIVGYLAAQKESFYFGNLKSLNAVNNSAIYSVEDCFVFLERMIDKYDK